MKDKVDAGLWELLRQATRRFRYPDSGRSDVRPDLIRLEPGSRAYALFSILEELAEDKRYGRHLGIEGACLLKRRKNGNYEVTNQFGDTPDLTINAQRPAESHPLQALRDLRSGNLAEVCDAPPVLFRYPEGTSPRKEATYIGLGASLEDILLIKHTPEMRYPYQVKVIFECLANICGPVKKVSRRYRESEKTSLAAAFLFALQNPKVNELLRFRHLDIDKFLRPYDKVRNMPRIGGDLILLERTKQGAVMGIFDVESHGSSAAPYTLQIRSWIQASIRLRTPLNEIMENVNEMYIAGFGKAEMQRDASPVIGAKISPPPNHTTCILSHISYDGVLEYCNAGHPHPLLLRTNGTISELPDGDMAIGVLTKEQFLAQKSKRSDASQDQYNLHTLKIAPGDTIIYYTDGLTDTTNRIGEGFGQQRLMDLVYKNRTGTVNEMTDAITRALYRFSRGKPKEEQFEDDVSLAVVRYKTPTKG